MRSLTLKGLVVGVHTRARGTDKFDLAIYDRGNDRDRVEIARLTVTAGLDTPEVGSRFKVTIEPERGTEYRRNPEGDA